MDEREEQGPATAADVQLMIAQLDTSVVATEDELAFYDALAADPSAVEQMDGSLLARIAHELYEQIRRDVTVDWKVKEQVRDRIMARVLRLLRKYGYPPDKQPAAIERVLKQAEDMVDKLT
ncbi:type I restriction enzyme endonuclease domain-containing protein [Actinocorallia aurantiaca]|uniref:Type I restriction enzyme HindI endonuclease subunit-like C-terminal domain-containing protein n=1 Tax=Actinocorallia aurantiaca TaxID=46204 RepID=A0ABP6GWF6_9ACTN